MLKKLRDFEFWLAWPLFWFIDQYMLYRHRRRQRQYRRIQERASWSLRITNLIVSAETKEHREEIRQERKKFYNKYPDDEIQEHWDKMLTDRDTQLILHMRKKVRWTVP